MSTAVRSRIRPRAWQAVLAFGAAVLVLYLAVPPLKGSGPVMNVLGLLPVLAIVVGIRIYRPEYASPWWWFASGFLLFWLGDLYTYSYPHLTNREVPFPSIGDAAYLAVYPLLMTGLLQLVRRRSGGGDLGGLVDSAILTVGLALPSWIALIAPYLHDHSLSPFARLVSVAYPLCDVLLLAVALRLALDGGRRSAAFHLMIGSIVCLLVTDFVYGLMTLHGTYEHQLWLDAGWIGFYVLWGAAALHPSMRTLTRPAERESVLTPFRLGLLTTASLIAPTLGLVRDLHEGDLDMAVVRSASIALFGLVIVRMAGLMRQQERMLERERVFTRAGVALVAATSKQEIDDVAVSTALDLVGPRNVALLCQVDEGDEVVVVSCAGTERLGLTDRLPASLAGPLLKAARDGTVAVLSPGDLTALGGRSESAVARSFAIAVLIERPTTTLLVVAGPGRLAQALQPSVQALAAQVALALESVTLTAEVHRRQGEARLGSLVRHASDLITVVGRDGTITYQSPSIERLLGYTPEEVTGRPFGELVASGDRTRLQEVIADDAAGYDRQQTVECTLLHRDGTAHHFEVLHTNLLDDEHVGGIVLNCRDVSERRAFEEQLTHQAFHDPVTKLANRALFGERVRHALARARREDRVIAVVFLDLDDFKMVNDSLGHAAGDEALLEVAKRLEASIRASDTAARFGGDEFALLLEDSKDLQEAADVAERVLETLGLPMTIGHTELTMRASMGIAIADGAASAEEMIRDADAAMYIAKRDGKGAYRVFEPAMHEGVVSRLELRADLQRALATEQLELHYQPVVRLSDGSITGVEALLRWRHPEKGMIGPDQFIPLAEETGLIVPIGRWVLREGCRQARRILDSVPDDVAPTMSINLSLKQLQHSDLVSDVREALEDARLEPSTLTLEITETVLMADTDVAVRRLNELKNLGVQLALDDFGTGYSSLSYLSRFPVDILKMDRSFLRPDATPGASELATAVVGLGASLNLDVVAEGIELVEQWEPLRDLGCRLGQGFYFARPMDADATLTHLLTQYEQESASRVDAA